MIDPLHCPQALSFVVHGLRVAESAGVRHHSIEECNAADFLLMLLSHIPLRSDPYLALNSLYSKYSVALHCTAIDLFLKKRDRTFMFVLEHSPRKNCYHFASYHSLMCLPSRTGGIVHGDVLVRRREASSGWARAL